MADACSSADTFKRVVLKRPHSALPSSTSQNVLTLPALVCPGLFAIAPGGLLDPKDVHLTSAPWLWVLGSRSELTASVGGGEV